MKNRHLSLMLAVVALLTACKKKPDEAPPEAAAPPPAVAVDAPAAAPPPPGGEAQPAEAPPTADVGEIKDSLPTAPVDSGLKPGAAHIPLTEALHRYFENKGVMPQTFQQLVAAKYIEKVPPAPAGKRWAIDRRNLQVVLVDQ